MLPATTARVSRHTTASASRRIRQGTEARIAFFSRHPGEIAGRLAELDREWDIERSLEANAASLALTGIVLGATLDRRWLALPAAVTAFLLQHALQGWCPPLPLLRRLGFRTASEIEQERQALKALRGDYARVAQSEDRAAAALQAARV